MNETDAVFQHPATKAWIANLTGRYTYTESFGTPSRYFPGDFSMPHTDFADERTVAYVWHLSRDWNPSWGGALYWTGEPETRHAYVHATYNTLNLFSVTRYTSHFVSRVASHAPDPEYKRLTWNGWWKDDRVFNFSDPVELLFDTHEKRISLTQEQESHLLGLDVGKGEPDDPERQQRLTEWQEQLWEESQNDARKNSFVVDLYNRLEKEREEEYSEDILLGLDSEEEDDDDDDDDDNQGADPQVHEEL